MVPQRPYVFVVFLAAALGVQIFYIEGAVGQKNTEPDDDSGKRPSEDDREKNNPKKRKQTAAECISHTTEARHIMGYDHLVHIKNACETEGLCKLSTDVNPQVQSVTIAPGQTKSVLTFRGSPARTFKVALECRLATE